MQEKEVIGKGNSKDREGKDKDERIAKKDLNKDARDKEELKPN